jgi:hypothetical protein
MRKLTEEPQTRHHSFELFRRGFVSGIGWSFGVTIGFVLVSTLIVLIFNYLGGIPRIGNFIANIVEETQVQLSKRSVIAPN